MNWQKNFQQSLLLKIHYQTGNAVALKYYGIDEAIVQDCAIYISTGATAEEIAVFEANSADHAETILAACRTRREKTITSYSWTISRRR